MAIATHLVFGCYGFWLPNDPRGSWSRYVGSRRLLRFGPATWTPTRESLATQRHDVDSRLTAKKSLKYPVVTLSGIQARAVAKGIAAAVGESMYILHACSIMRDHVHMVVRRHNHSARRIIGHFKGRATQKLTQEGIHPLAEFSGPPTPWARGGWFVHLDDENDVLAAIEYVSRNPLEAGLPSQKWSFVKSILD